MTSLSGRTVLVVGASSGIGRSLALAAVRAGADTVLAARRRAPLEEAVAEAGGGRVVTADITEAGDVARMVAAAAGPLDLVVLAAGSGLLVRLADAGADQWSRALSANVVAHNQVLRAVVSRMAPGGIVAVLSSETVGRPRLGLGLYGVGKAALDQSVLAWQEEHPEQRFCRVTVGATMPTGFGDAFDPALVSEALGHWLAAGEMQRRFMPVDQVAATLLGTLAVALDNPGVNLEHLRLRAPSARAATLDDIEF